MNYCKFILIILGIISVEGVYSQFNGGTADGFSYDGITLFLDGGKVKSIVSGGLGDGFNVNGTISLLNGGTISLIFNGGSNDGYDEDLVTSHLNGSSLLGIFNGGINDGYHTFENQSLLNGVEPTRLFVGGVGDGYSGSGFNGPLTICFVANINDSGIGSLRYTIGCTEVGANVVFDPDFGNTTIVLDSAIIISKDINILPNPSNNIVINGIGIPKTIDIKQGISIELGGMVINGTQNPTGIVRNHGNLRVSDIHIKGDGTEGVVFLNFGTVEILNGKILRITPN